MSSQGWSKKSTVNSSSNDQWFRSFNGSGQQVNQLKSTGGLTRVKSTRDGSGSWVLGLMARPSILGFHKLGSPILGLRIGFSRFGHTHIGSLVRSLALGLF